MPWGVDFDFFSKLVWLELSSPFLFGYGSSVEWTIVPLSIPRYTHTHGAHLLVHN
jgi:hypothetical protein